MGSRSSDNGVNYCAPVKKNIYPTHRAKLILVLQKVSPVITHASASGHFENKEGMNNFLLGGIFKRERWTRETISRFHGTIFHMTSRANIRDFRISFRLDMLQGTHLREHSQYQYNVRGSRCDSLPSRIPVLQKPSADLGLGRFLHQIHLRNGDVVQNAVAIA